MTKQDGISRLATIAKQWSHKLNNAVGGHPGQAQYNLGKIDDALIELVKGLTKREAELIRIIIGTESSSAYSCGIEAGKRLQSDNDLYRAQREDDEIAEKAERPANVVRIRA